MPNEGPHHKLLSYEELFESKQGLSLDKSPELVENESIKKADNERKTRSLEPKKFGKRNKKGVVIISRNSLGYGRK